MTTGRTGKTSGRAEQTGRKPVSLKELAARLNLSPATVSLVVNGSHVADSIPQETKQRIFAAVKKYKYRPNFFARSLRAQRSFTIGVIVPEVSDGYSASVMSGVEDHLLEEGYFYFGASHRHRPDLIDEYPRLFLERSIDGLIAVDTPWTLVLSVPVVTVSGHNEVSGVTNIVLDHKRAAEVALKHLFQLGHRQIAFIKGQEFSSDTEVRWANIEIAARQLGQPAWPERDKCRRDHPGLREALSGARPAYDLSGAVNRQPVARPRTGGALAQQAGSNRAAAKFPRPCRCQYRTRLRHRDRHVDGGSHHAAGDDQSRYSHDGADRSTQRLVGTVDRPVAGMIQPYKCESLGDSGVCKVTS